LAGGWVLGNWQQAFVAGVYLSAVIIALAVILILFRTKAQLARLREEVARLSEDMKHLLNAEQRRFLQELKLSKSEKAEEDKSDI
jgi:hypothetical protein